MGLWDSLTNDGRPRGRPRLSVEHHKRAGTYRRDRHGPRVLPQPQSEWQEPAPDPGQRYSHEWETLSADEPRRRLDEGADPATATEAPYGIWDCLYFGYESSFLYLQRRALLRPGEVEQIQERLRDHVSGNVNHVHWGHNTHTTNRSMTLLHPAEAAAILQLFGPLQIMVAEEISAGEVFLKRHLEYPFPIAEAPLQPFNE